jgi:serine/threonine protein phosphatase PrpC
MDDMDPTARTGDHPAGHAGDPTSHQTGDPPRGRGPLALRYAALSDVGRVRKDNQDSAFASERLLVIADGVGGAARGDLASSTAIDALRRLDTPTPGDLLEALAGAIHRAHDRIAELVEQDPGLEGTSTTVTAVLFDGSRIGVAHIGDSRGYLLRDGTLSQLTRDHTFVQGLIDEGRITEEESRSHPHRNLILRAVDGVHETDPDLFYIELAPGDRLLLCSDGASGVLDQDRLTDILRTGSVDYAVVELIRASLEAGSSDNVTCVVADVVELDQAQGAATTDGSAGRPEGPATSGPILVGAAAEQSRRIGAGSSFRGHRGGDTGEIDPVPGEEEADADPEELRYAPRAPRRGRWLRRLGVLLVLALVLAVVAAVGYRWSQSQYFVAEHAGKVAIFRGVQADIPGVSLSRVEEDTDVSVAALPDYPTEQVAAGISATSLADARSIVHRLTGLARVCPGAGATSSPSPSATSRPTPRPTRKAGASAGTSPRPTTSAGPTPSAGSTPSPSSSAGLAPPDCIEATS